MRDPETKTCVARAESERGELFLFRRGADDALELRVNGVFVMDTVHTSTERLLATETLGSRLGSESLAGGARVLIGGLGLGFTLREVLADRRVTAVRLVEIEPAVVEWNRQGLIPDTAGVLLDERVDVSVGDVAEVLGGMGSSELEVLLLDVDNGPGFLVYDTNSAIYRGDFLLRCRDVLTPGGVLAVWSSGESPELASAMRTVFARSDEVVVPVELGTTSTTYHLYIGAR